MKQMKEKFSATAHWEVARGTPQENKDYCTKSATKVAGPWEFGELPPKQGSRSDLKAIWHMAAYEKKDNLAIFEATQGKAARYFKEINHIRFAYNEAKSDRQQTGLEVLVFYGATGLGKTYCATNYYGNNDYHIATVPSTLGAKLWFDGYQGQQLMVIDDYEGKNIDYRFMLRLLDHYKLILEIKGGSVYAVYSRIIITTNVHPSAWFPKEVNTAPLRRRIHHIYQLLDERDLYQEIDWNENKIGDVKKFVPVPPYVKAAPAKEPEPDTEFIPETPLSQRPNKRVRRNADLHINEPAQSKDDKNEKGKEKVKDGDDESGNMSDQF